jgi:ABC-type transport system involved in cytochrome c biogenesis ATPase subunit
MLTVQAFTCGAAIATCLRGVSFEGVRGKCVLLTGRNGAGKTTLIRAIAGLLDPEEGQVSWRGAPARAARD